jgi:hypothetical protein
MDPRIVRANEYTALAAHNLGESMKLREMIEKRKERLLATAAANLTNRPTTIHTVGSIAGEQAKTDDKMSEYSAGLNIVERRATMYSNMATDLRMQVLCEMQQIALKRGGLLR